MSAKTRNYPTASSLKGHAKAQSRKSARHQYTQSRGLPWSTIMAGVALVLIAGLLALNVFAGGSSKTGYGKIAAQSSNYAFGDVPWKGGNVTTKFELNVQGDTTVNDIVST